VIQGDSQSIVLATTSLLEEQFSSEKVPQGGGTVCSKSWVASMPLVLIRKTSTGPKTPKSTYKVWKNQGVSQGIQGQNGLNGLPGVSLQQIIQPSTPPTWSEEVPRPTKEPV